MNEYDPPPERPSESDCCGTGCTPCVLDVYEEEYCRWKRRQRGERGDRLRRDLLSVTKPKAYRITSVRQLCNDVHMYTFASTPPAEGRLPVAYTQHVHVCLNGVTRPYTPVSLSDKCSFDVIIKAYPNGKFTEQLLGKKINDIVLVRGPSGGVDCSGYESIIMFCGGTGVAAFLGLVRSLLENDKCDTLLQIHYSCKTLDGVLMRSTLAEYAEYWNCAVFLYLTRENDWPRCSKSFRYNENMTKGRISQNIISGIANKQQTVKTLWLVCGNDEFNRHCFNSLQNHSIKKNDIRLLHNTTTEKIE